jgi:hypothetical protein
MPTVRLSYRWRDDEGNTIVNGIYQDVSDFAEVADYQAEWGETRTVMEAISLCKVEAGWVEIPMVVGSPGTPAENSRVNTGATLSFRDSLGLPFGLYVPHLADAQISGKVVNQDSTEMAALKSKATGGGSLNPWSSRSSAALLTTYIRGYLTQRKIPRS